MKAYTFKFRQKRVSHLPLSTGLAYGKNIYDALERIKADKRLAGQTIVSVKVKKEKRGRPCHLVIA